MPGFSFNMASPCSWSGCGSELTTVQELVKHISEKHLDSGNPENLCLWKDCDRYEQPFHNRSSLNAHIRRHTGERPFICKKCQKSFSRSDALSKHVKTSHNEVIGDSLTEDVVVNEQFGPIDYILKNVIMENLVLKRKLYFNDLKKKRLQAHKIMLLETISKCSAQPKSNS